MQHMLTCKLERGRPTQLRLLTAACAILAASLILTRRLHFPLGLPFLAAWDSLIVDTLAGRSTVKLDWQLQYRSVQLRSEIEKFSGDEISTRKRTAPSRSNKKQKVRPGTWALHGRSHSPFDCARGPPGTVNLHTWLKLLERPFNALRSA